MLILVMLVRGRLILLHIQKKLSQVVIGFTFLHTEHTDFGIAINLLFNIKSYFTGGAGIMSGLSL